MAVSLKHAKTSAVADGGNTDLVQPSDWNSEHTLTLATDKLLGRTTAGTGAVEEVTCTDFAQSLLDDDDAATARTTLGLREILTASRTYYVRTDGNNSNNGLANTSGGAFLTIQKAIDTIFSLDLNGQSVTIQVGDGTYTGAVSVSAPWVGIGTVTLQGNTGTPANCVISTTSSNAITVSSGGRLTVLGFKLQTTTAGSGLEASGGGGVKVSGAMEYGACATAHLFATSHGDINISANYTISGAAAFHAAVNVHGSLTAYSLTVTLTGTPAFSSAYAYVTSLGLLYYPLNTFSGSATGVRYSADTNGVIYVAGAASTYLPGNSVGSTASGAQYA